MSARDIVLGRVREALGGARLDAAAIAGEARALVPDLDAVRPPLGDAQALDRFVEKATSDRVTATVERLEGALRLPAAVAAYLGRHALGRRIAAALPPALFGLDWRDLDLVDEIDPNEPVALTFAEAAVAETGSLVFPSSEMVPTLFNFLPLHHLAVVRAEDVVPHLEDALARFQDHRLPRSLIFVTGTSGTADIEGKNIRGAHGPRYLHIYIIDRM